MSVEHMNAEDGGRCLVCEWPYAADAKDGCVPGNCAYRPDDPAEQRRIASRRIIAASHAWDGGPPKPGTVTDRGAVLDTPEMWALYRRCGGAEPEPVKVERRLRRVLIAAHVILDHFVIGHTARLPRFVRYPVLRGLPRDARIEGMPHFDHDRMCFSFLVSHPSFPPVPDGDIIPVIEGPMLTEYRAVEVKVPE